MKILAIGDFHGKFPEKLKKEAGKVDLILSNGDYAGINEWRPLLKKVFKRRENREKLSIEELIGKKRYKILLRKDYEEGKKILIEINRLKVKCFSVFGNGDWYKVFFNDYGKNYEQVIKKLRHIKDINRGKGKFRNLRIMGFGGYIDNDVYFTKKGSYAVSDGREDIRKRKKRYLKEKKRFMKLIKIKPDILLTHYNPYKCLDKMKAGDFSLAGSHMGISFFNKGIRRYSPMLVICGHMHENQGARKIGKSLIVNPGAAFQGKAAVIELNEEKKKVLNIKFLR